MKLKTHNGELGAKIEQLKAKNEQLKEGCGRRGVPHTPVPGAPVQRPRLLGDLALMSLLDKSFGPTWVMRGASSGETSMRYFVGTCDPSVRFNVEALRRFADRARNY